MTDRDAAAIYEECALIAEGLARRYQTSMEGANFPLREREIVKAAIEGLEAVAKVIRMQKKDGG